MSATTNPDCFGQYKVALTHIILLQPST